MNTTNIVKQSYTAPAVEVLRLAEPLRLLVSVSMEVDFEDWEEGDEL